MRAPASPGEPQRAGVRCERSERGPPKRSEAQPEPAKRASFPWREVERLDFVYLVTYRKPGEDSRCVLECSAFQDVINAILSLWGDECCQFEVFRATAL